MKTIVVFKDEEITSLIDRIISTKEDDLILMAPAGSRALKNPVDFQLLRRETDILGKVISIASSDPLIVGLARKAGFEVKGKVSLNQPIEKVYDIIPPSEQPSISVEDLFNEEEAPSEEKLLPAPLSRKRGEPAPEAKKESIRDFEAVVSKDILPSGEEYLSEQFWRDKKFESDLETSEEVKRVNLFYKFFSGQKEKTKFPKKHVYRKPVFIVSLVLLVFVGGYLFFFSGVVVTVNALASPITLQFNVLAGIKIPAVDDLKNEVPAQLIKIEKSLSGNFNSSGEKDVETKARGIVLIYNGYSSGNQFLRIETRFESPDGIFFKTVKGIIVPGAKIEEGKIIPSKISAEVVADEAGADYNIGPAKFTIPGFKGTPKFSGFYGQSEKPMSGGAKGKVKVITASDVDKAKSEMEKKLSELLKATLLESLPKNLEFLSSAYKEDILESAADPSLNEVGENFEYRVKGWARGLMFEKSDMERILIANLAKELKTGEVIVDASKKLDYTVNKVDFDQGLLELKLAFTAVYYQKIDEGELMRALLSKSEEEIKSILLSDKRIESAQVKFWPFWLKSAPKNPNSIKLTVINPD